MVKAYKKYGLALQIRDEILLKAGIHPAEFVKMGSSKVITEIRREIAREIDKRTGLEASEIGKMIGRPNWRRSYHQGTSVNI